jgi:hypothetical protein
LLPYVSSVSPIAPESHFTGNPSPYTTTKPANISCSNVSRLVTTVLGATSCSLPHAPLCPSISLAHHLVPCSCSLPRAPPSALLLLPPSRAAWWLPPPAPSAGRHLLLPPSRRPCRFIWRIKAELRAGNLIQSIQILYKPLYMQNNHYSGKSATSRLTYRLVSNSVPW